MNINGKPFHTIWVKENDSSVVQVIDQRLLPHKFIIEDLKTVEDTFHAIKDMIVRGAPLIGVTAAYGVYLSTLKNKEISSIIKDAEYLRTSRPTAVNLMFAIDEMIKCLEENPDKDLSIIALQKANDIKDFELENCKNIGEFGVTLIEEISKEKNGETVNILTHCNAGWLACVDYGTATAPIYEAFKKGLDVHVWVDETRPRNQGAKLTAFELGHHGIPHTVIADNTGGHLMQHGMVDLCIVGSDRTTKTGDVANKIGTYLKALAAKDNDIPFYVALPSSTIDWNLTDGVNQIPIEKRESKEVKYMDGLCDGALKNVLITPETSNAENYGFDVTPARLVTGLITEKGICKANQESIEILFNDKK